MADPPKEIVPSKPDEILGQLDKLLAKSSQSQREVEEKKFMQSRLEYLIASSIPRPNMFIGSEPHHGFIHPDSSVKRHLFWAEGFHLDDPQVYQLLIESFKEYRANSAWANESIRKIAPHAILRTIGKYLGNYQGDIDTEIRNREFYINRSLRQPHQDTPAEISIKELKGQRMAVCAEKGALAQNLLTFLGYDSTLIFTTKTRLNSEDEDDLEGHVYNLVRTEKGYLIFDPTNPVIEYNKDGSVNSYGPAFYEITQDQYIGILNGKEVEVEHRDRILEVPSHSYKPAVKRLYGGANI